MGCVLAARILDGKALANRLQVEISKEVAAFRQVRGIVPKLVVVLVGEDPASRVYVRNKSRASQSAGIEAEQVLLPASASEADLLESIDRLNADESVHGILVQLPLPKTISDQVVIDRIDPRKDVDGFHPDNVGRLWSGRPRFIPCTPLGIQRLLVEEKLVTKGLRAVVLGRSNIVGKPMASLLMAKGPGGDATVTVCHTATTDPSSVARDADLLIVAMGQPEAVTASWVKPGAVVIDVGIHRRNDGTLCGDVEFSSVKEVASAITPVPGGVGPLTVAMLLSNTLQAARGLC